LIEQIFPWVSTIITALITGGLFSFVQFLINRHDKKNDSVEKLRIEFVEGLKQTQEDGDKRFEAHEELITKINEVLNQLKVNDAKQTESLKRQEASLVGMGHDRILYLGSRYIERGYITKDEYENLNDYLFKPYKALGGNGTAEKIMREVDKLPLHDSID
jgi:hypothetical protein